MSESQDERDERQQIIGEQAVYRELLSLAICGLRAHCGADDEPAIRSALLELQHSRMIAALRRACDEFGDNDWSDDLTVEDIIEKHLLSHIRHEI